jgi:uncharacterized protein
MHYGYYETYFLLVLPAILISLIAQWKVKSTYARYSEYRTQSGMTGAQIARRILDENGLQYVGIESISGELTDHYDPNEQVVRLSRGVYYGNSVAALGVAAHETGHAVQDAQGYVPLRIRIAIIPATNLGAKLSMPILFLGLIAGIDALVTLGILLFSLMTVFQLVTLPVEFNASRRALYTLSQGVLTGEELDGTRHVLTAAALTYVAALLVSAMQLLRLVLLYGNRRRR